MRNDSKNRDVQDSWKPGPKTFELLRAAEDLATLLRSSGYDDWASRIHEGCFRLRTSDFSGIKYMLGMFGGMGSLNDLVLKSAAANKELNRLSDQIYSLARAIQEDVHPEKRDKSGS